MAAVFTGKGHIGKKAEKAVATRASLKTWRKHGQEEINLEETNSTSRHLLEFPWLGSELAGRENCVFTH